jgi:hypothetical protein
MRDCWALNVAIHRDQWHSLMGSMSKRHIGVGFFRNQGLRVGNPQCQSPPPPHFMYTMIRKARANESKTPLAPRGKGYNNSRESATDPRATADALRDKPSTVQLGLISSSQTNLDDGGGVRGIMLAGGRPIMLPHHIPNHHLQLNCL